MREDPDLGSGRALSSSSRRGGVILWYRRGTNRRLRLPLRDRKAAAWREGREGERWVRTVTRRLGELQWGLQLVILTSILSTTVLRGIF